MPTRRCLGLELLDRACKLITCMSWCDVVFSLGQQSAPRANIHFGFRDQGWRDKSKSPISNSGHVSFACHLYSTASLWLALKQGTATQNTWHTMSFTHIPVDSFGLPSLAEPHICSAPNSAKAKQRIDTQTVALLPSSKLRDSPSLERPNSSCLAVLEPLRCHVQEAQWQQPGGSILTSSHCPTTVCPLHLQISKQRKAR